MNFPQSLQRKLFFFCFLLVCLSSFAQADLFFTIKVLSNGMPISVDSIKVENLTSRSSFSLHSLPQTDSFYINLSRAKLERDPSGVSRLVEGAEGEWVCVETKPGNLILKTIATQKTPSYLRILNMQGRCVHNEVLQNTTASFITIKGGSRGVYLVNLVNNGRSKSFRYLGSGNEAFMVQSFPPNQEKQVRALSANTPPFSSGDKIVFSVFLQDKRFTITEPSIKNGGKAEIRILPPSSNVQVVDLGLKSGLKWASCNIGATNPWDAGEYFAWGETTPKKGYYGNRSLCYNKSVAELKAMGVVDNRNQLAPSYDAATANWGSDWRMPTEEDFDELCLACQKSVETVNGVPGIKFTGKGGNSIFIARCGFRFYNTLQCNDEHDSRGCYWTSDVCDDTESAKMKEYTKYCGDGEWQRYEGLNIRPVSNTLSPTIPIPTPTPAPVSKPEPIDLGLPSGVKWASFNLGASNSWETGRGYAWGETESFERFYPKDGRLWALEMDELKKQGIIDGQNILTAKYDAAAANLGFPWRMPTAEEIEELITHCEWTWKELQGVWGKKVTGPNGNSIFFPTTNEAASYRYATYWSSSYQTHVINEYNTPYNSIYTLFFDEWNNDKGVLIDANQIFIRPVCK